jgi:electron transport complex protein RnfG
MQGLLFSIRRNTTGIAIFAAVTAGLIAITQVLTQERIAANREAHQARALYEILPQQLDPNLHLQVLEVPAPELGMTQPVKVFQSIVDGRVEAVILPVTTAEGYSGDINLLVGIWRDGRVAGVRVIGHRETPGLGDKIELDKSDWILSFNDQRWLGEEDSRWKVRKDGGQFDQFTGATITPRAIVKQVAAVLSYYEQRKSQILTPFNQPETTTERGNPHES